MASLGRRILEVGHAACGVREAAVVARVKQRKTRLDLLVEGGALAGRREQRHRCHKIISIDHSHFIGVEKAPHKLEELVVDVEEQSPKVLFQHALSGGRARRLFVQQRWRVLP